MHNYNKKGEPCEKNLASMRCLLPPSAFKVAQNQKCELNFSSMNLVKRKILNAFTKTYSRFKWESNYKHSWDKIQQIEFYPIPCWHFLKVGAHADVPLSAPCERRHWPRPTFPLLMRCVLFLKQNVTDALQHVTSGYHFSKRTRPRSLNKAKLQ